MIKSLKPRLPDSGAARGTVYLAGSQVISQGLAALSAPLLTRLFSTEEFGAFALYLVLMAVGGVVICLRYEMAIPLSRNWQEARGLIYVCAGLSLAVASILSALFLAWQTGFPDSAAGALTGFVPLIFVALLLIGWFQVMANLAVREQAYGILAIGRATQGGVTAVLQVSAGFVGLGLAGLMGGHVLGFFVGFVVLLSLVPRVFATLEIRWKEITAAASSHDGFPRYTAWAGLINVAGNHAPTVFLSLFYPLEIVGLYALTYRVVTAPSLVVGQAVAQVFYGRVARFDDVRRQGEMIERTASAMLGLSVPFAAMLMAYGPELFAFLFGEPWREAGVLARYLSPWILLGLVSSPLARYALVLGRQRQAMLISASEASLRILMIVILGLTWGSHGAVIGFAGAGTLIARFYIWWVFSLADRSLWSWLASHAGLWTLLSISLLGVFLGRSIFDWNTVLPGCLLFLSWGLYNGFAALSAIKRPVNEHRRGA